MACSRRHLPHFHELGQPIFLTWRLRGSLPPNRAFPQTILTAGQAFVQIDRLLDETRQGRFHLRRPEVADMTVEAIRLNAEELGHFRLHAYTVMPNHVHLLATPQIPLSGLARSLKEVTAKRANLILGLAGQPFWQEESYDHLVRSSNEFLKIVNCIEENPVRAGLVAQPWEYAWSGAFVPNAMAVRIKEPVVP